jgi:hypothetical protein
MRWPRRSNRSLISSGTDCGTPLAAISSCVIDVVNACLWPRVCENPVAAQDSDP